MGLDAIRQPVTARRRMLGILTAVALVATACGGSAEPPATAAPASTSSTTAPEADRRESCPTTEAAFEAMNNATYAVYGERKHRDGSPVDHVAIGTAWAVDPHTLVTNAHVAEAFVSIASGGTQLTRAIAVQSRTGTVVTLKEAFVHEEYTGDPLRSADVAVFATEERLPATLPLADETLELGLGTELLLVGFPLDVTKLIQIIPGETVPQATSLTGQVTALRSHDATEAVQPADVDVIQHQAPTTPGTSGSAMVVCGEVIGVNNAGTVNVILVPTDATGGTGIERQAAAANNFGVHVRHIHEVLARASQQQLDSIALPVPATDTGRPTELAEAVAGTYVGAVDEGPARHEFTFSVSPDGTVTGTSRWDETGEFTLTGELMLGESFDIALVDDAPERLDFRRGIYVAVFLGDGSLAGQYFESSREEEAWEWTATRSGALQEVGLGVTLDEFAALWNSFAANAEVTVPFSLGPLDQTQVSSAEDLVTTTFRSGVSLGLLVGRSDGQVNDVQVRSRPETETDGEDLLLVVLLAVASVSPELSPDERVAVIGETGLLDAGPGLDFEGSSTRGAVRYAASAEEGEVVFHIGGTG